MQNNNYDIIVIGAGCGGLTAAVCAAKEGKKVLLLEKNNYPGGFNTSFVRGRFEFDTSVIYPLGLGEDNQVELNRLFEEINISDKVSWKEIPEAYRFISKNRDGSDIDIIMPFGIDNYIDAMEHYVPGSRNAMQTLFSIGEEIEQVKIKFENTSDDIDRKFVKAVIKEQGNFTRTAPYSVNEVLNALKLSPKAIDIINALWFNFGVDCDKLSFTHYIGYLYTYIKYGSFIPADSSSDINSALVDELRRNGGEIRYNSPVSKILFNDLEASGIVLKTEEIIPCKHIICTISPNIVYSKMMDTRDVPSSALKRTNARTFGARSACVFLGLNKSCEELGIEDYSVIITDEADSADQYALMKSIETNNALKATCVNIANPDCSPKGTSILCLSTIYTDSCWSEVTAEKYYDEKDLLAARLIANYETATGVTIHNSIEELEVATPVTFARYTGAPQGVTHGYYAHDWDSILPRIMTEATDCDTKGLRFCGSWGTQLSSYNACVASGRNALYATLEDIKESEVNL